MNMPIDQIIDIYRFSKNKVIYNCLVLEKETTFNYRKDSNVPYGDISILTLLINGKVIVLIDYCKLTESLVKLHKSMANLHTGPIDLRNYPEGYSVYQTAHISSTPENSNAFKYLIHDGGTNTYDNDLYIIYDQLITKS